MKILVVSDSHGNSFKLQRIFDKEQPCDAVFHCGDGVMDIERCRLSPEVITVKVTGNVDRASYIDSVNEEAREIELAGRKILAVHGDRFNVKNGYYELQAHAFSRGIDIVFCGHTHIKKLINGSPVIFNPGSANDGCYGIASIDENDENIFFEHRNI